MPFLRQLHYGDNLQVLREYIASDSVDLIYLDPPFNSKRLYNVYLNSEAQATAFNDAWTWTNETEADLDFVRKSGPIDLDDFLLFARRNSGDDMGAYTVMMSARLIELNRVLNFSGSIYLHCDPTASHYLKIIMDSIFGKENFRNDIIWKRTSAHSDAKKFGAVHDNLLYYTKSSDYVWNEVFFNHDEDYLKKKYNKIDPDGRRFQDGDLTAAGTTASGSSGKPWRGIDPTLKGCHWAIRRTFLHDPNIPQNTQEALDYLDSVGRIYWPKKIGGLPRIKRYIDETPGMTAQDVITDINPINARARERLGYPTQKPVSLLERIISISSKPNDLVLDPFCGCGTAIEAAEKLGRQWSGIDITILAINLIDKRLKEGFPKRDWEPEIIGTPKDLDSARELAAREPYQFQLWACSLVNPGFTGKDARKGADGGIDGIMKFNDEGPESKPKRIIISVKGGSNIGPEMVRSLIGVVQRENAAIGLFITLAKPTKTMLSDAAKAGFYQPPRDKSPAVPKIQILMIEDLLSGRGPKLPPDFTTGTTVFKRNRPVLPALEHKPIF